MALPPVPAAEEIYDMLMAKIEPDLVRNQIPLLGEKYKNETPEEKEQRSRRYTEAFAKFDAALKEYVEKYSEGIHRYKHQAIAYIESRSRQKEESDFDAALEQKFSEI